MKILLFGATGQVGTELQRFCDLGTVLPVRRADCDLRDPSAIQRTIRRIAPQLILNAAAFTAVDQAESEVNDCSSINGRAPAVMAEEAAKIGALLVHYSTDYVFDGEKNGAYKEEDPVNPLNQYGRSKLEGELAIQASRACHLIFRTSWVFSPHGKNFVKTVLRLATERDHLRIVHDQIGSPTSAAEIARATFRLLRETFASEAPREGLYHMTSEGYASWYDFARRILERSCVDSPPFVEPVTSEEYPTPARRPRNSRLSNDKFAHTFGFRLSSWQQQLDETLAALLKPRATL